MRRVREAIEQAKNTIEIYRAIGSELSSLYDDFRAQGFAQIEFTWDPKGIKFHFPKEADEASTEE